MIDYIMVVGVKPKIIRLEAKFEKVIGGHECPEVVWWSGDPIVDQVGDQDRMIPKKMYQRSTEGNVERPLPWRIPMKGGRKIS